MSKNLESSSTGAVDPPDPSEPGSLPAAGIEQILPLVYDELKRLAERRMKSEPPGHTLQPTALVHEVYLRLLQYGRDDWQDRRSFVSAAAVAMRRILIERARRYRNLKRGSGRQREPLSAVVITARENEVDLVALDDALTRLAAIDERKCSIVTLRYLLGCTVQETASALGVSTTLVKREWAFSKAWLRKQLDADDLHTAPAEEP